VEANASIDTTRSRSLVGGRLQEHLAGVFPEDTLSDPDEDHSGVASGGGPASFQKAISIPDPPTSHDTSTAFFNTLSSSTHSGEYVGQFVGQDALVGVDYASRLREHAPAMAPALEGEHGGSE
jgi:hypothetical protein